jgi:hypothetical protein
MGKKQQHEKNKFPMLLKQPTYKITMKTKRQKNYFFKNLTV